MLEKQSVKMAPYIRAANDLEGLQKLKVQTPEQVEHTARSLLQFVPLLRCNNLTAAPEYVRLIAACVMHTTVLGWQPDTDNSHYGICRELLILALHHPVFDEPTRVKFRAMMQSLSALTPSLEAPAVSEAPVLPPTPTGPLAVGPLRHKASNGPSSAAEGLPASQAAPPRPPISPAAAAYAATPPGLGAPQRPVSMPVGSKLSAWTHVQRTSAQQQQHLLQQEHLQQHQQPRQQHHQHHQHHADSADDASRSVSLADDTRNRRPQRPPLQPRRSAPVAPGESDSNSGTAVFQAGSAHHRDSEGDECLAAEFEGTATLLKSEASAAGSRSSLGSPQTARGGGAGPAAHGAPATQSESTAGAAAASGTAVQRSTSTASTTSTESLTTATQQQQQHPQQTSLEDEPSNSQMHTWLKTLRLHKYAKIFENVTYEQMIVLTDEDLQRLGVSATGARTKMLKSIEALRMRNASRPAQLRAMMQEMQSGRFESALNSMLEMLNLPMPADVSDDSDTPAAFIEALRMANNGLVVPTLIHGQPPRLMEIQAFVSILDVGAHHALFGKEERRQLFLWSADAEKILRTHFPLGHATERWSLPPDIGRNSSSSGNIGSSPLGVLRGMRCGDGCAHFCTSFSFYLTHSQRAAGQTEAAAGL